MTPKPAAKAAKPAKTSSRKSAAPAPAKAAKASKARADKQAAPPVAQAPGFTLEPVIAASRKLVPAARQAELAGFLEAFYRRMEAAQCRPHGPRAWAAIGADMLEFARKRKPGTANVRVFNPALKANGWESPYTVLQIVNDDMPFLVDSVSMALAEMGVSVHVL